MRTPQIVFSLSLTLIDGAYLNAASGGAIAPVRYAVASRNAPAEMVASKEIFSKYLEGSPSSTKTLSKVPKTGADAAAAAAIAATAAAGFTLMPSSKLVVQGVGGALGSIFGIKGRKKLAEERKKAARPAVAALLADGLEAVTPDKLASIMKDFGIDKKEFQVQLGELYLAYFDACLASPEVLTAELSELLRLQEVLRLTPAEVGNKVYAAARNLYSRHRAYLEDADDNESKQILNKFVFLAERVLSADESEEGYRYETLRLQKQFGILQSAWTATAEKAAMPFYDKALASAVLDGKAVTTEQLAAVRASLGITDGCADGMHEEVLTTFATRLLQPDLGDDAKITEEESSRLVDISTLLTVETEKVDASLTALTAPLYKATFATIAADPPVDVSAVSAQVAGKLSLRQSELRLPVETAREIEIGALRAAATDMLAGAAKFVRIQNVGAALEEVRKLVSYTSQMSALMSSISHVDGDAEAALTTIFSGLDSGDAKASEILSLYRVFLLSCLETMKVSETDAAALAQLRTLTGMTDEQSDSVYEASAGPIFRKAVAEAVAGGMDAGAKAAIAQSLADLSLPAAVTATIQREVYEEEIASKTEIKKIVDEEEAAKLVELRDFLGLSFEDVEPIHAATFNEAYSDAVLDVFKQAAPITDEYWEGLESLQQRLGLSDATSEGIFAQAAQGKMKGLGEKAVEALEAKVNSDMAKQRKETGQVLGEKKDGDSGMNIDINAGEKMLDEIMGLISFAESSRVLQESGIATSLKGQLESKSLKELYRQFLVEAFSGKSPEKNQRIFANMDKLVLVLGLDELEVKTIHDNLGSVIYRQVCSNALESGDIGVTEQQTLESIKNTLGMEAVKCETLINDCKLFRVSTLVDQMFERSSVTADDSRQVRDAADMLGIDLLNDAKVNSYRLERMYMVELEDIINSGELTPENTVELAEICEPLHIDEETAARLLEATVSKRCGGGLLQAAALLRQGAQSSAIEEIDRMLKFALLSPEIGEVDAKSVGMRERNELALLYSASSMTGGELSVKAKEKLELLKQICGIQAEEI